MKKLTLILMLLLTLSGKCQRSNMGTEFWMAFMKNVDTAIAVRTGSLQLYMSANAPANVTVSIPRQSFSSTFKVAKDSVVVFNVPLNLGYINEYETAAGKAIHITSDFPISVSAMNLLFLSTDASIVLPYANIPNYATYVAGNPSTGNVSQIMLVAGQDSTKVEVTPTAKTISGFVSPFKITLNKGEIYQIGANYKDLSGTVIKVLSPNKLMAFTGDMCGDWPCGACDHQFEQILPDEVLDTAYCAPSHFGHDKGYYLKIIPIDSSIDIKVNGFTYRNIRRIKPLVINVKGDSGYYVSSKKPFHCYQFLKGASCNGYIDKSYGDPSQLELISTKYFAQTSLFSTITSSNLKDHFVNIVIRTSSKNDVYLDKIKIDSSEFIPFDYAKQYAFAKIKLNLGQHLVECSDGLLAYCYGLGRFESYLYLSGFSLPNLDLNFMDTAVVYDCKNKKIKMQFSTRFQKALRKYTWYFGDNTIDSGISVQHLYTKLGVYTVKLVVEDYSGVKDSVSKVLNINWPDFDPVRSKVICGPDTITFIEKNPFFTNFRWQDNSTLNYYRVWSNKSSIHVIATDTTGYCKFSDSGSVVKVDISPNLNIDSIEKCWKYNRFIFRDSTILGGDSLLHKSWVFPWKQTIWDTSKVEMRFPMPGRYKVYFDIYTTNLNCKARFPINIVVNPMPKVFAMVKGDLFCANNPVKFYDSSVIVSGYIKKVKWLFDDATIIESDSLKTFKRFDYIPNGDIVRFYKHIPISDRNCMDTVLNAVKVWPKPKVDFTLSSPDTISCLPAARWTFTSISTIGNDTMNLFWDAGNGKTGTNYTMKNIRYSDTGKYNVKLKAVSSFGCIDSLVKQIEVLPALKAAFTINDSQQCFKGNSFSFSSNSVINNTIFTWYPDNGKTYIGHQNIDSITYMNYGQKKVTLKISVSHPGCEDSVSRYINILREPLARLIVNNDTQCLNGNLFNLRNISVFYQPYASSRWISKNNTDTNFNLPSFSLKDTGNTIYSLVVSDLEGCSDTTDVLLRINPQTPLLIFVNDSIQCFNANQFIFSTNTVANAINQWRINNRIIRSGKEDSLTYTAAAPENGTIRITRETIHHCLDSTELTYRLLEPVFADFIPNKDSQCFDGHNFNFKDASVANHDIIKERKYIINNANYPGLPGISNFKFTDTGIQTIRLVVTTNEGCTDTNVQSVTLLSNPQALITGDSVCLFLPANIKATQLSGSPVTKWDWDFGDGFSGNKPILTHIYNTVKKYKLTLEIADTYGCTDTITLNDGVIVYPLPDATFSYLTTPFAINEDLMQFNPVLFKTNAYYWQFPNGSSSSNTDTPSLRIKGLVEGTVWLKVRNQYGCEDSSSQFISVYPVDFTTFIPSAITPNNDGMNDVFQMANLNGVSDISLTVFSRWGEEIFKSSELSKGWDGKYKGSQVEQGLYPYILSFTYYDRKNYTVTGHIMVLR